MKRILVAVLFLLGVAGGVRAQGAPGSPTWKGTPHGVQYSWTASTTAGVTYNLYRGSVTGGPYTLINTAPITTLSYLDPSSGLTVNTTYFVVATAVDATGSESAYSNEVSVTTPATFPVNPQPPSGLARANK